MRKQHLRRGVGICLPRRCEAAAQRQEPAHLALRVMEPTGARPTIRPAKDCAVAMLRTDAHHLFRRKVERPVPTHLDITVVAPRSPIVTLEPAFAHRRFQHPRGGITRRADPAFADPRRVRITGQRLKLFCAVFKLIRAPMGGGVFHRCDSGFVVAATRPWRGRGVNSKPLKASPETAPHHRARPAPKGSILPALGSPRHVRARPALA